MKGDFTRNTFNPTRHFRRVLMQQGRVQLDADWNEQDAILLHYIRRLSSGLIGPHGGPADFWGFGIATNASQVDLSGLSADEQARVNALLQDMATNGFLIGPGDYYIDGVLVENERYTSFVLQPSYPLPDAERPGKLMGGYLVYLHTFERHITYVEDDSIREVALGGPDTASRSKLVWQVETLTLPAGTVDAAGNTDVTGVEAQRRQYLAEINTKQLELEKLNADLKAATENANKSLINKINRAINQLNKDIAGLKDKISQLGPSGAPLGGGFDPEAYLANQFPASTGTLQARARLQGDPTDPCVISPGSQFRGLYNQLYRVEIHDPSFNPAGTPGQPTFKWSRENGSVILPLLDNNTDATSNTTTLAVASLGHDERLGVKPGDYVELVNDDVSLLGILNPLWKVTAVDHDELTITLQGQDSSGIGKQGTDKHAYVRRWDSAGLVNVDEPQTNDGWIDLEDGVQVHFDITTTYNSGDYWLIPARTATGDVEWPHLLNADGTEQLDAQGNPIPEAELPRGVEHLYAPLAIINAAGGTLFFYQELRKKFGPLAA
jgi:hypothetical protein